MIRYLEPLFTTEQTAEKVSYLKHHIKMGIGMVGLYVITLSANEQDVFDIYNAALFKQRYFRKRNYDVIGIAENEEAAYELVKHIFEGYHRAVGTYMGLRGELLRQLDEVDS